MASLQSHALSVKPASLWEIPGPHIPDFPSTAPVLRGKQEFPGTLDVVPGSQNLLEAAVCSLHHLNSGKWRELKYLKGKPVHVLDKQ